MSLYTELVEAGIDINSHESDLYFPVSKESTAILDRHPELTWSTFIHQATGISWYDVPFMYEPWWRERQ